MSKTVDERVVSMQFDNRQFESNVQTSLGTLAKLKQSLNLSGASKGLEDINSAARRFDMSGLSGAVDTVRAKFSALEVMAVTTLANITNSAVNAGKRLVSAFTIDPIKSGMQEYETQINAVQTILSNTRSKGTTLDQVNNALDELNHYADMTIYNFTEMTRNIGTFTAAGVDLDTSVSAIKGIANLAAVSGSTSQQASTAMYQLSQALASGTVKLQDWNSVVNAGMGGQVFQDALKETARVHGIAIDDMIKSEGSFRETLSEGWLSSEILTETLAKFTGDLTEEQIKSMGYTEEQAKSIMALGEDANNAATKVKTFTQLMDTLKEAAQSGWTQTWEILIGDFEEAKSLWTEASDYFSEVINKSAEARNNLLQGWADGGGREMVIESVKNAFNGLLSILKPIKEAFREVFPPATSEQLLKITERIRDLTAKFKLTEKQSSMLKATFKGLFSGVSIGVKIIKAIVTGVVDLISHFSGLGTGILTVTSTFGNWLTKLKESADSSNIFSAAVENITDVLGVAIDRVKEFIKTVASKFKMPGFDGIKAVAKSIVKIFGTVLKAIGNLFTGGSVETIFKTINAGLTTGILAGILKFVKSFKGAVEDLGGITSIKDSIVGTLDSVKDTLQSYQDSLKAKTLQQIAIAIGILAGSLLVLSLINPDKLASALTAMAGLFGELMGSLAVFGKVSGGLDKGVVKASTIMITMSASILILSAALKKLSSIDMAGIGKGLLAIGVLMAEISVFLRTYKFDGKMTSAALGIVILSSAMLILAKAVKNFGNLSWGEIGKGLASIGALLLEISAFANLTSNAKHLISTGVAMVFLGTSMKIFASAMKDMSGMSWEEIGKGLATMAGSLAAVTAAMILMPKNIVSKSIALIGVATAITILGNAVKSMGSMSWGEVARGITAMAGALAIISVAMHAIPKDIVAKSVGLIGVAAAITVLGNAVAGMSSLSWIEIAKGMVALGGSLLIIAVGLRAMSGTLAGSAALLVAAGAFAIFVPILKTLGSMSFKEIGAGLLALAGVFAIFGAAAAILSPLIPAMLALSGAVALLGVGCALAGVGILALAVGLSSLSAALVAVGTSIATTLVVLIQGFGDIVVAICKAIADSAPAIAEALVALVTAACKALKETIPMVADTLLQLITELLKSLETYTPQIVESIFNILIKIIDKLSEKTPELVKSALKLVQSFLTALGDALTSGGLEGLLKSIQSLSDIFLELAAAAFIMSKIPISGALVALANLGILIAGISVILTALGGLAQIPGFEWIIGEGTKVLGQIGTAIGSFVGNIVGSFAEGVTSTLPQIGKNLSNFMANIKPFIEGIKSIDSSALDGVKNLAAAMIALAGANLIDSLTSWLTGGSSLVDFGKELAEFGKYFKSYSDSISGIDTSAVAASAVAAGALSSLASNLPNSGGLVSLFTGDNSIAAFGEELVTFGKSLKSYADNVSGIDSAAVIASADAAKGLAQMADMVPNSGGMKAWFIGDNSIAAFGDELVLFGRSLKSYADSVTGINSESILSSVDASKALVDLSNSVPNEGGIKAWFTGDNSIAAFGTRLASFGNSLKAYSQSVTGIDTDAVKTSAEAGKALAEMADTIPNSGGIKAWFSGENSVSAFGRQIAAFGNSLKAYSDNVTGIDVDAVKTSAEAGKALAEMADTIPNEGGIKAWFTGENSISAFGRQIAAFGNSLKAYSDNVTGIDVEAVKASSEAGKALAQMASTVPNEGGIKAWFAGDNSLASFGEGVKSFGRAMKSYSESVTGIDTEAVKASAEAGKSLAQMADTIPNEGGIKAWFSGENSLASFSEGIVAFGRAMKAYSESVTGIDTEAVTASANAGKTLAEMVNVIPNEGGLIAWFSGENSLASFSEGIKTFGRAMKSYSESVAGIDVESVTAAASAGKTIAEMTNIIPNSGGLVAWFAGENSLAAFGEGIKTFGRAMKVYSESVAGIDVEAVRVSTEAGKTLAEMTNIVPNYGGLAQWFSVDGGMASFGEGIKTFGRAMKSYSESVAGIDAESVKAATAAGTSLADLTNKIPNSGGIQAWFSGEKGLAAFSSGIPAFGRAMKAYSDSATGIDAEAVRTATAAGKNLADLTNKIPNSGGIQAWFSGERSMASFSSGVIRFGGAMSNFSKKVSGIDTASVSAATKAGKTLAEMTNIIPSSGGLMAWFSGDNSMASFSNGIIKFGTAMKTFSSEVSGIDTGAVKSAASAGKSLAELTSKAPTSANMSSFSEQIKKFGKGLKTFATDISGINVSTTKSAIDGIKKVFDSMKRVAKTGVDGFTKEISNGKPKVTKAVNDLVTAIRNAASSKESTVTKAFEKIAKSALAGVKSFGLYSDFYKVGQNLADGFANGISANSYKAAARSKAMANAAYQAAKKALAIHSPSKVFKKLGMFVPEGFAMGIDKLRNVVANSSKNMAENAISGTSGILSKIVEMVNSDVDTQPTIRPVLDLSDISSGADTISGMLSMNPTIGAFANANSISSMMNRRQNGANSDVISAIKDLGRSISNSSRDTYTINGITYDDGSNVSDAVRALVRAARVERRV